LAFNGQSKYFAARSTEYEERKDDNGASVADARDAIRDEATFFPDNGDDD